MLRWTVLVAIACFGCGRCGGVQTDEGTPRSEAPDPEAPAGAQGEPLYDANGDLLPSREVVAGLTLPRGLTKRPLAGERRHVYVTQVPLAKVQAYFGPRLITGQVDRVGAGAVFRRAVPREARGGVVHLDVGVYPVPRGGARVEIYELPPVPQNQPPPEELMRRFDEEQRRLD
ncbi:MAG: hypothetical protein KF901_17350 [Myxococcales bacterium]|nr:hypothetical protein [Myxococcales bacterium]